MKWMIAIVTLTVVLTLSGIGASQTTPAQPTTPAVTQPAVPATPAPTTTVVAVQPVVQPTTVADVKTDVKPVDVKPEIKAEGLVWWKLILKHLMEFAFAIFGLMATALITVLMKKYGFEHQSTQVNEVLEKAVGWAEQKSIKAAKLDGKPTPSAEKMEAAVSFALTLAKEYKLADKGKDWWSDKLESWLGVKNQKPA